MKHKKKRLYTEIAYLLGLIILAFGSALVKASDFGVAMVVAPAYLICDKLSTIKGLEFVTFGMAEMLFQIIVFLLMLIVIRKFKVRYLFFFVTTLFYGLVLDGFIRLVTLIPGGDIVCVRIVYFIVGLFLSAMGVAFLFHTYITPESYELFVMEVSKRFNLNINRFKTIYDISSCILAIIMSLILFNGEIKEVGWGTAVAAVLNGFLVGVISRFLEKRIKFVHLFKRLAPPPAPSDDDEPIEPEDDMIIGADNL